MNNTAEEIQQLHANSAELSSLRQSILGSELKKYFPQKEGMSFHDKVVFAISSLSSEVDRLRGLLREFVMRANYAFPETEQDLEWFEAGIDFKTEEGRNFTESIFMCVGLGKDVTTPQDVEEAKKRFEKKMKDHNKMKSVRYPHGK